MEVRKIARLQSIALYILTNKMYVILLLFIEVINITLLTFALYRAID